MSNSNNLSLAGANNSGHAEGTTQSAVSEGAIVIRDKEKQKQDVAGLSRDTENANGSIGPIFDKEKEQNRLKEAQLIGEIGGQAMDIIRTQGDINGLDAALKKHPELKGDAEALRDTPEYKAEMAQYGTGSDLQKAAQAVTAALQGLAGGNIAQALTGASAPYLAGVIKQTTGDNQAANAMAHAVLGAVTSYASGHSGLSGAAGAAATELLVPQILAGLGWNKDSLTEEQKQTVSMLSTLAAGLAGGITGDSTANGLAGAQAGKNAVENNALCTSATCLSNPLDISKPGTLGGGLAGAAGGAALGDAINDALKGEGDKEQPNVGKDLTDAEKAELGGSGSGTPGGWEPQDEEDARNSQQTKPEQSGLSDSQPLSVAEKIGILRDAAKGNKGNFGLGQATTQEANALGEAWVGPGYRISSDGTTWVSRDGLRTYRPPSAKPNSTQATTGVQANFEQKLTPGGRPISNGHLDITK